MASSHSLLMCLLSHLGCLGRSLLIGVLCMSLEPAAVAQPPFKPMYRLSPSEFVEVKRQVTEHAAEATY